MVVSIAHAALRVVDMERSLDFYCRVVGLTKAFEIPKDGRPWIVYLKVCPGQFVELFYNGVRDDAPAVPDRAGFAHLCLQVDDVPATARRLADCGVRVTYGPVQGSDRNWQCWADDPDGNPIEFMQVDPESPQARS